MAASAWQFYNEAKRRICNNEINLSAGPFRLALYTTAASASIGTDTVTIQSEIANTNECAGGTYNAGGLTLAGVSWGVGTSAGQQKFDCTDPIFTASSTNISNVRFALIVKSIGTTSGYTLVRAALSTAQFDVTTPNTLTIQMNASGIFTLA